MTRGPGRALRRDEVRALAEQLAAVRVEVESGAVKSTATERARIEGAAVVLDAVLGLSPPPDLKPNDRLV